MTRLVSLFGGTV